MKVLRPPLLLAAAAGLVFLVLGRLPQALVLLLLVVVQVQGPVLAPVTSQRAGRAAGRFGRRAEHVLGIVVWVPVGAGFVVAGWLARLLRIRPLDPSEGWLVPAGGGASALGASSPWTTRSAPPVSPARRRARLIRRTAVAVVLIGVGVAVLRPLWWSGGTGSQAGPTGSTGASTPIDPPYALRSQADADQVRADEGAVFSQLELDPTVGWRLPARVDGQALSVADHRRTSVQAGEDGPVVWFFGGSTMFGSNQSDEDTIPSVFAELAAADGHPVHVVNFGVHAYTSYQEAQQLDAALAAHGRPDLVVFYDGYNDTVVGLGTSFLGLPVGVPQRAPSPVAGAPTTTVPEGRPAWLTPQERYAGVADAYRAARTQARRALGPDTPILSFWQPNAFTKTLTGEERRQLRSLGVDDRALRVDRAIHAGVRAELPTDVIDLTDVLDGAPTVFVDQVHTNELGAELVATAMYEAAQPTVEGLTGPS